MRNVYEPSKLSTLGSLVLVSGLLGVVAAFILLPVFGGAGLAAKAAATTFENLPSDLQTPPLPQRSTLLAANGHYLASFYSENRVTVTLPTVPDVTRKAVVAIEDSRFYEHNGVDVRGIARAFVRNQAAGADTQGASTLTQQYVKRVLLEQAVQAGDKQAAKAAVNKNKARKVREIRYALALEQRLSKDQILERYLNIAYFGAGAYGIGTAATVYFGKPTNKLTLAESALLAGLLQSPSRYDPILHKTEAAGRRNVVLGRMADLGFIPVADAKKAALEPLVLHRHTVPNGCSSAGLAGHFCDYVRRYLLDNPKFGPTPEAREARLFKGGLRIRTTYDPRLQALATAAVAPSKTRLPTRYNGGLAVVQPGSGRVLALALSKPFVTDQNPYLTGSRFQTGSTAKVFVLVGALLKGMPLTTSIYAPHDYTSKLLYTYDNGRKHYSISNDSRGMVGLYDMRSALAASVNTYYVQLEERVGVDNAVRAAMTLGVSNPVVNSKTGEHEFDKYLQSPLDFGSFTLGAAEISPLDMANSYATIAAHGKHCVNTPIESITGADGKPITGIGGLTCRQVIDPGVADAAAEALLWPVNPKGHVTNGNTAGRADIGRQAVGGKTGTTQDIKEAWFVGFSPQLAVASVVFDPLHQKTLPGGDSSNRISVRAFHDFMKPALEGRPIVDFAPVDPKFLHGVQVPVPNVTGKTVQEAVSILTSDGFTVQVSSQPVDAAPIGAGLVGETSPSGGSDAAPGTTVTIYVSNGQYPAVNPAPPPPPPPRKKRRCPPFCGR